MSHRDAIEAIAPIIEAMEGKCSEYIIARAVIDTVFPHICKEIAGELRYKPVFNDSVEAQWFNRAADFVESLK